MKTAQVIHADCLDAMGAMEPDSIDAIVSDPPYGLSFMGREWDHRVPGIPFWAEALCVAKPGAHLVAFGGTRTYHRLACAIEDAGWEIRDCLSWLYGSGYPKSHDVSKAIDKGTGENRARQLAFTAWMRSTGITSKQIDEITGTAMGGHYLSAASQPAIATADQFDALRPYLPDVPEEIERLVAERTGIEWIAYKRRAVIGTRFGINTKMQSIACATQSQGIAKSTRHQFDVTAPATDAAREWQGWGTALKPAWEPIILARKPLVGTVAANVLAHGTGALNIDGCRIGTSGGGWNGLGDTPRNTYGTGWKPDGVQRDSGGRWPANVALDEVAAAMLDEQTGTLTSGVPGKRRKPHQTTSMAGAVGMLDRDEVGYADSGGASRFFYTAKASRSERGEGNTHPTVKPIALMRWLVRLVTPKGGVVLDPFAGSGTTLLAAHLEGHDVVGIEREVEYIEIIRKRIASFDADLKRVTEAPARASINEPSAPMTHDPRQLGLFDGW